MSKNIWTKSKISQRAFLQSFNPGERVVLKAEPAYQKGMYHLRFHGKVAEVLKKRGDCYEVKLSDRTKEKTFVVHPVHLKKVI